MGTLYAMGTHPVIINGLARTGIPKGRLPAPAGRVDASGAEGEATMAEIVTAYCASHAPMQAVDPESAPKHQADDFFAGLKAVRDQFERAQPQAVVMLSGEHFTNYFLDALPQLGIGLERSTTPRRRAGCGWSTPCFPVHPSWASTCAGLMERDLWPALSYEMSRTTASSPSTTSSTRCGRPRSCRWCSTAPLRH